MKKAIVVGSGAGGSTVARQLQGTFHVTVFEAGDSFHPFTGNLSMLERLKRRTGSFIDERLIQWMVPAMKVGRTGDGLVLVRGVGQGGTTTISTGSALRQDQDLKGLGIDLDPEFEELSREIPIFADHESTWHAPTHEAYAASKALGLHPSPTPKMIRRERCVACGACVLGCPRGAKWDSREFLRQAVDRGALVVSGRRVKHVTIEDGRATGVIVTGGGKTELHRADLVVLSAGGLGTPAILAQSGIACEPRLFVDPVLCVATRWDKAAQNREIPMPFTIQGDGFMISPYFDYLSYFFNRSWRYPAADIFSLMIKLADTNSGDVFSGGVRKQLLERDHVKLAEGVELCRAIFHRLGKKDADIFLGTLNAGHPGGMLPLTVRESKTLHSERLPANLYVADSCLFPNSLGNPPILTIMALAKRISRVCQENAA